MIRSQLRDANFRISGQVLPTYLNRQPLTSHRVYLEAFAQSELYAMGRNETAARTLLQ